MLICEKIFEKDFTDVKQKHEQKLVSDADFNKAEKLLADESEVREKHCEICQEVSGAFYMSSNKHLCDSCKMKPYCRRLENKVDSLKKAMKGVIELE